MHIGTWLNMHDGCVGWFSSETHEPPHLDEVLVLSYVQHRFDIDVRFPLVRIAQASVKPGLSPRVLFKCTDGENVSAGPTVFWRPLPDVPEKIAEKMKGEFVSISALLARCCDEPTLLKEKAELSTQPTLKNLGQVAIINDALQIIYNGRKKA